MNILFYKLLVLKELKEQADYILNSRDSEYNLENIVRSNVYNPLEKLKELEYDLDSQLLNPEIREHIKSRNTESLGDTIGYLKVLDELINERFKFYGIFILKEVYNYLSVKEIK